MITGSFLLSCFFLAAAVLAAPRLSGNSNRTTEYTGTHSTRAIASFGTWAGAIQSKEDGFFDWVTGTFTVPHVKGKPGSAVVIWVGIDGDTCPDALLQTGVIATVTEDGTQYDAWYEWYPDVLTYYSGVTVSPGDVIKADIVALSKTVGMAGITNLSNGQSAAVEIQSNTPLCGKDVEWIVESPVINNKAAPLAEFGSVTFTNAKTTHGSVTYTPRKANIETLGSLQTYVTTSGDDLTIKRLGL